MATFYQVGGSVRDELLGLKSKDIDYAVEAESFDHMRQAIIERGGEIFLETPQFLTIRANVPKLGACDYVLCRKDGLYTDGRHPETVSVGTIFDDLARRDFTVNAIAKAEGGTIIDPYKGQKAIKERRLQCVGDARNRFSEDGLRMLRAIRFAITKRFTLSPSIWNCLESQRFFEPRLKGVSIERVREELHKCLKCDTYSTLLAFMEDFPDLGKYIFTLRGLWLKPTLESR